MESRRKLKFKGGEFEIHDLAAAAEGRSDPASLPHTVKILLENLLRLRSRGLAADEDVAALARWPIPPHAGVRLPFLPARILMQDFTGVPAVVDLAALRSAVARAGGDPAEVNPTVPADLIIDHSVQVDRFGSPDAHAANLAWEYRRNAERYTLLRWAQQAFDGLRVVPPGLGICHQVNLEHLGRVVRTDGNQAFPDTVLGTDSHTTMINGLGILGWGVGGIEAEAAMLGHPVFLTHPEVVGVQLEEELPVAATATDLVLTLTEMLRAHGVVGRFVEFCGPGLAGLTVEDRATIANMCPEYGATAALFPTDAQTIGYLERTGRDDITRLVEAYTKEQGLFRYDEEPVPTFSELIRCDLSTVEPSVAGPKRPQDRVGLPDVWPSFLNAFRKHAGERAPETELGRFLTEGGNPKTPEVPFDQPVLPHRDGENLIDDGSVVIAAITSCTNTSNPSVMIGAGLLAKKAVEAGLATQPWVKTSLAPGSRVVTRYLEEAGLLPYLEKLGFSLVGYGCTTCIGNSGPLPERVASEVAERDLTVVAVLSGNRNFEGRIHPQVRASYLASPPLCVAYALAGRIDLDLTRDPIGGGLNGPVHLRDIWPSPDEVRETIEKSISPEQFADEYALIFRGEHAWTSLPSPEGALYEWDPASTYVKEPPYFQRDSGGPGPIESARVLALLGESVTTDHISPAGSIKVDSPAGRYLQELGVEPQDFNSYGARRGNHEVMMRGTFANIRLRNLLTPGREGPWTRHLPGEEVMWIYDAAERYRREGVSLIVVAGKEYGSGSSRDWAAKGPALLGVRAVVAGSFERIHRSNLVGMGILPLRFAPGESADALGLDGTELFSVEADPMEIAPGQKVMVEAARENAGTISFVTTAGIENEAEAAVYRSGGILPMVMRRMMG